MNVVRPGVVPQRNVFEEPPPVRARAVAPLVATHAARIEAERALVPEVVDALHANGLFRCLLPLTMDGEETTPVQFVQMTEALATADASTAWCVGQSSVCAMSAAYMTQEAAWEVWGRDRRAALAWGAGPQGTAQVVEGGYRVSGTWQFASGSRHATWLGGHCRVIERDGSMRLSPDGSPCERTMLVRREQADITQLWEVMGLRGTGSDTYTIPDLFVPDAFSLCRDADAERRETGPLYQFSTTNLYAAGFAGVSLGIARGALDAFKALACKKTPQSAGRRLADTPFVQHQFGVAEARLRGARSFLMTTLQECWDGVVQSGALTLDQRVAIRMACVFATHQAKDVVDFAYHEAGATAIFESQAFERRFRDMNAVTQQIQARSSHFETVGAHLLGNEVSLRFL